MEEYTYGGGHLGSREAIRIAHLKGAEKEEFWREPKRSVRRFWAWFALIASIVPVYVLIWHLAH